jgi:hypothetical protein
VFVIFNTMKRAAKNNAKYQLHTFDEWGDRLAEAGAYDDDHPCAQNIMFWEAETTTQHYFGLGLHDGKAYTHHLMVGYSMY